ncbi:hypothetical protein [Mycobacterium paraterrae]|uniref:Uncharacterized protein n=1 Tax=Mycobacterium paraterrae TaxID=577492 RepID=A0ABY3VJZ6_9MYCO|nr:hypothetical protein [Mycobacterium paraterrae]UMB69720.1 hypothetical protein MKK62_25900 [Mycobacterium paraterrae]
MSITEEEGSHGQPTRCSLVAWSTMAAATYSEAKTGNCAPSMAIDIAAETISVVNVKTDALVASAPAARVSATPATYQLSRYQYPLPGLVIDVAGVRQLSIGCYELQPRLAARRIPYRFSWQGEVTVTRRQPEYFVSATDFITLVETFTFAAQLQDSRPPGTPSPWYQRPCGQSALRWLAIGWITICLSGLLLIVGTLILDAVIH